MASIRNRKIFLILTKYIPHLIGFMQIVYTLCEFAEINMISIGYLFSLSILPWIYCYSASKALEFCYVHRLPLYYILLNEILLITDYYIGIPVSVVNLLIIHLLLIGLLIMGYTYYYVKRIKNRIIVDNR